jgi:hypothetical protein
MQFKVWTSNYRLGVKLADLLDEGGKKSQAASIRSKIGIKESKSTTVPKIN